MQVFQIATTKKVPRRPGEPLPLDAMVLPPAPYRSVSEVIRYWGASPRGECRRCVSCNSFASPGLGGGYQCVVPIPLPDRDITHEIALGYAPARDQAKAEPILLSLVS